MTVYDMGCRKKSSVSISSDGSSGDENKERGNWVGRLDFIMSCISYAVGLGNIWRFPYLCYRNGGAAFLIPYLIFLALCGMPLFFIEVSYGQFASLSPIAVWKLSPLFKGLGYGMVIISGIVCIYYNIIIAWTVYYLIHSFMPVLPWATCDNSWNTDRCVLRTRTHANFSLYGNDSGYNVSMTTGDGLDAVYMNNASLGNATIANGTKFISPSEEFWERQVLQISDGIDNMGGIRWELFGCLLFAWVAVFLCLIRGIKSSGRVVYFTATFPYIVLFILLVRGVTLPGSWEGIKFYIIPDWNKLLTMQIWGEAAMQIFYSIGAAWGALITMASYNKFHNNCYRDSLLVPMLNSGTSIFAGFAIFSIIGFMAHVTGSEIQDVVTQGPGLVFVVYPQAVAALPLSQIWAILFFAMLFSVGLGSQFAMFQTMTSALFDEYPILKTKKMQVTAALCCLEFLMGLPCITNGGIYYLQIMDWYSSTFSLMIVSFTECMVISWIYGVKRFYTDIEYMIGYRPCVWWRVLWSVVTPVLIVFILGFTVVIHKPVTYGSYVYPAWAVGVGWVFAMCSIVPLPVVAFFKVIRARGPVWARVKRLVRPAADWGPALEVHRDGYLAFTHSEKDADVIKHLNHDKIFDPDDEKKYTMA